MHPLLPERTGPTEAADEARVHLRWGAAHLTAHRPPVPRAAFACWLAEALAPSAAEATWPLGGGAHVRLRRVGPDLLRLDVDGPPGAPAVARGLPVAAEATAAAWDLPSIVAAEIPRRAEVGGASGMSPAPAANPSERSVASPWPVAFEPHTLGCRVRWGAQTLVVTGSPAAAWRGWVALWRRWAVGPRPSPAGLSARVVPTDAARWCAIPAADGALTLRLLDAEDVALGADRWVGAATWPRWAAAAAQAPEAEVRTRLSARQLIGAAPPRHVARRRGLGPAASPNRGVLTRSAAPPEPAPDEASERAPGHRPPRPAALPAAGLFHLAWRRRWQIAVPGLGALASDRRGLRIDGDQGAARLDPATGRSRWTAAGLRWSPVPGVAWDAEGLVRLDDEAGAVRWRAAVSGVRGLGAEPGSGRSPGARATLVATAAAALLGVDAATGEIRWRRPCPAVAEVVACAGAVWWWQAGQVVGLDRLTGAARAPLSIAARAGVEPAPPATAPDEAPPTLWAVGDRLLVAPEDRPSTQGAEPWLALRPADGAAWRVANPGPPVGSPWLSPGARTLVLGVGPAPAWTGLGLDWATGAVRWRTGLAGQGAPASGGGGGVEVLAPVWVGDARHLLVKTGDGAVTALRLADGGLAWRLPPDDAEGVVTVNVPPRRWRGLWLVSGASVRAVDPATGRVVHTLRCDDLVPTAIRALSDGALLLAEGEHLAVFDLAGHLALVPDRR